MTDKQEQGALNREWGALAEKLAADFLIKKGYAIRERNYRLNHIEIDIIAQIGNEIVFVEVKARKGDNHDPYLEVDHKKRNKMIRGADTYLRGLDRVYYYRFDIITITGTIDSYTLDHYPDAFLPEIHTGGRS